jgi:hypothetical protein
MFIGWNHIVDGLRRSGFFIFGGGVHHFRGVVLLGGLDPKPVEPVS